MKFETNPNLNGQSQCFGCKQKGIWNVEWSCMMFICDVNGKHYCTKCSTELLMAKYTLLKNRNRTTKRNKYVDYLKYYNKLLALWCEMREIYKHTYLRPRIKKRNCSDVINLYEFHRL